MDNNITSGFQTLGKKAFWLFFLQISPAAIVALIIFIALFTLSLQPIHPFTQTKNTFDNLQQYYSIASVISFFVFLLVTAISFTYVWLVYINYTFSVTEDSFKIKRGILNKTEAAIPYRQIQDVNIERSLFFLMLGLSRLIILTAGHEEEKGDTDESGGFLPAIDKKLAESLQTELLRRADIQKTVAANNNL